MPFKDTINCLKIEIKIIYFLIGVFLLVRLAILLIMVGLQTKPMRNQIVSKKTLEYGARQGPISKSSLIKIRFFWRQLMVSLADLVLWKKI